MRLAANFSAAVKRRITERGDGHGGLLPKGNDGLPALRVTVLDVGEALRRKVRLGGTGRGSTAAAPGDHADQRRYGSAGPRSGFCPKFVDTNFVFH